MREVQELVCHDLAGRRAVARSTLSDYVRYTVACDRNGLADYERLSGLDWTALSYRARVAATTRATFFGALQAEMAGFKEWLETVYDLTVDEAADDEAHDWMWTAAMTWWDRTERARDAAAEGGAAHLVDHIIGEEGEGGELLYLVSRRRPDAPSVSWLVLREMRRVCEDDAATFIETILAKRG